MDHAADNEMGQCQDASPDLSYQPHTSMHTIAPSIANVVADHQPLASILATNTRIRPADNFVDPLTVRFADKK